MRDSLIIVATGKSLNCEIKFFLQTKQDDFVLFLYLFLALNNEGSIQLAESVIYLHRPTIFLFLFKKTTNQQTIRCVIVTFVVIIINIIIL